MQGNPAPPSRHVEMLKIAGLKHKRRNLASQQLRTVTDVLSWIQTSVMWKVTSLNLDTFFPLSNFGEKKKTKRMKTKRFSNTLGLKNKDV